jgi:hypothetical protein
LQSNWTAPSIPRTPKLLDHPTDIQ